MKSLELIIVGLFPSEHHYAGKVTVLLFLHYFNSEGCSFCRILFVSSFACGREKFDESFAGRKEKLLDILNIWS